MLTSGAYKGDPVARHKAVSGIEESMFAAWLALFEDTAGALFAPALAAQFSARARRIAESLRIALFYRPDRPWTGDLRKEGARS